MFCFPKSSISENGGKNWFMLSMRISSYARGKFGQHERSVRVARLRNENVDKQNQNTHVEVNIFVQNFHSEILQLF